MVAARRRQPGLRRLAPVVEDEALLGDAAETVVKQHQLAGLDSERGDVLFLQRVGDQDQAIAAALDQKAHAFHRLAAFVARAGAEGQHHVQAGRAQFGIHDAQDRRVEGPAQHRDVDPDHAA
jgi:hypothetical protein